MSSSAILDHKIRSEKDDIFNVFPSVVPPIKILIIHNSEASATELLTVYITTLARKTFNNYEELSHKIFYIAIPIYAKSSAGGLLVQNLRMIKWCKNNRKVSLNFVPDNNTWNTPQNLMELAQAATLSQFYAIQHPP